MVWRGVISQMELTAILDTLIYIMKSLGNVFQFYAAFIHKF